jgi:queuine tRNA-ribosyltransferase
VALFGIVQGSVFEDLRERAVRDLVPLDFDGYAIGGVSVGEEREAVRRIVAATAPALPEDRPRYLMGLGTPADLVHGVRCGVDLFDCVLPSRNARHGLIFTRRGTLRIKNARFASDGRPLDEECPCPTCRRTSRAFLHHLFRSRELTGKVLATLHNLRFYLDFMEVLRQAVEAGTLAEMVPEMRRLSDDGQRRDEARSRPTHSPCSRSSPLAEES